jgi:hypothetical protein
MNAYIRSGDGFVEVPNAGDLVVGSEDGKVSGDIAFLRSPAGEVAAVLKLGPENFVVFGEAPPPWHH